MIEAGKKFYSKWKNALQESHLENPYAHDTSQHKKEKAFFQASDLRARDPEKANILYLDGQAPNKSRGSGFGRAFDNLSMIAELGHRITLVTECGPDIDDWCDKACVDSITGLGIEYANHKFKDMIKSHSGYYDLVLVSRPNNFITFFREIVDFYRANPFALVYDCEALVYRCTEALHKLIREDKIQFPGGPQGSENIDPELINMLLREEKRMELSLISISDATLPVSDGEAKFISQLVPSARNMYSIGHIMSSNIAVTKADFDSRNGILYLAGFNDAMYYNGDAIWYFLTEIYPLVVEAAPIPLTIAGKGIPKELRLVVEANEIIAKHVTFVESPKTVDYLFQENRVFVAPHLYGAGIQYICLVYQFMSCVINQICHLVLPVSPISNLSGERGVVGRHPSCHVQLHT
mmetsp:Transcript_7873/g.11720  ORF Transcript_7873/g.11720 Transcript_7873/m.11720 type:complete len:408 (+) Transcript_7873:1237-2460(+)